MDKLKEFFKKHKKLCVTGIVAIVCLVVYLIKGEDMDSDSLINQICNLIGC